MCEDGSAPEIFRNSSKCKNDFRKKAYQSKLSGKLLNCMKCARNFVDRNLRGNYPEKDFNAVRYGIL